MGRPGTLFSRGYLWRSTDVIFVTVGNYMGFPRLVRAVDSLKAAGVIEEEVLLQIAGTMGFTSQSCTVVPFLAPEKFEQKMRDASIVISHGGAGSMIEAFRAQKMPIVMPRRAKYGEHVDDHQVEGARALAAEGRIILIYETAELPAAILQARRRALQPPSQPPSRMVNLVARAIEELLAR
jgi:UDP-N-acetylglucosamine transferase subunit ALG13